MLGQNQDSGEGHTGLSPPPPGAFPPGEDLNENLFEIHVAPLRPVPFRTGIVQIHYQTLTDLPPITPDPHRGARGQPVAPSPPSIAPPTLLPSRQSDRKRTVNLTPKTH